MASDSGDNGSVFPNSAQDVLNLVIDSHYVLKRKKDMKGSRAWQQFQIMLVSRYPPGSDAARLELCLILRILNEGSKCSELRIALHIKHTLQKKVSCLQWRSLYSTGSYRGQIRVRPVLLSGSVGHPGQWYWPSFSPGVCVCMCVCVYVYIVIWFNASKLH